MVLLYKLTDIKSTVIVKKRWFIMTCLVLNKTFPLTNTKVGIYVQLLTEGPLKGTYFLPRA